MLRIKANYLPAYQDEVPEGKICLLISDRESRQKIRNTTKSLCGENARAPLKRHRGDYTLVAKVSNIAIFMKENQVCSQSDLLGLEVEIKLELRKYRFVSKYEYNRGEQISGTYAVILSIIA